jgi:hypothetical protein
VKKASAVAEKKPKPHVKKASAVAEKKAAMKKVSFIAPRVYCICRFSKTCSIHRRNPRNLALLLVLLVGRGR